MGTEKVSRKPRAAVVAAGTEAETEAEGKVITSRSRAGGARRVWLGRNGSILEDGRVSIEGVSGTRAGSMNAVVYAYG
jgi:NTE family protein